jgi:hypothetical protein
MAKTPKLLVMFAVVVVSGLASAVAQTAKSPTVYTVVNDENTPDSNGHFNSGSVYVNGVYTARIVTGSYGIDGGGYLGNHSVDIDVLNNQTPCVFIADAGGASGNGPGDVYSYDAATRTGTRTESALGYNGDLYGMSLEHHGDVLIVGWAGSGALETFIIGANCELTATGSSANAMGLNLGTVDEFAIAPNGQFVAATYEDGSYGVYPLSGATISAPAQYNANCSNPPYYAPPVGIAISPDSSTVYLDCLYGEDGALIDTFAVSNPSVTITNGPINAAGGTPVNGSVTMGLSPDGTVLYVVGTFSGAIESTNVSGTSVTPNSCSNFVPPGYNSEWIYPGTIDVLGAGAGQGLAIPQTAFDNTPDSYLELLRIDSKHCLSAVTQGTDANSMYALSGASYVKQ